MQVVRESHRTRLVLGLHMGEVLFNHPKPPILNKVGIKIIFAIEQNFNMNLIKKFKLKQQNIYVLTKDLYP